MYELYFDGACEPNPGTGAVGWVLKRSGEVINSGGQQLRGRVTNNQAEYVALALGVRAAKAAGIRKLAIYGDSELVVKQVNKKWACKAEKLIPLRDACLDLLTGLDWSLRWVARAQNHQADGLSKAYL